jgi:hypothetical protein
MILPKNRFLKISLVIITSILALGVLAVASLYIIIPNRFADPKPDHAHFRLQYIFRGKAEDFSKANYQVEYAKDICSGLLTESPLHFHDNKDQIVHLHWQKMTGGDVLKFYGVNKEGGLDNYMGLKLDKFLQLPPKLSPIPIYGKSLPEAQNDDKYFVYTGEKDKFEKRDFNQFINQSLEEFLGKNSTIREQLEESQKQQNQFSSIGKLAGFDTAAQAHGNEKQSAVIESDQNKTNPKTEEELKQINNFIGNVVIFVQPNEPTNEEVQAKFNNLVPLEASVCGG